MGKKTIETLIATADTEADVRVQQLLKENAGLRKQLASKDAKTEIIKDVIAGVYAVPSGLMNLATPKRAGTEDETAVLHITDMHYGKRTVSFDADVCVRRVTQLCDAVEQIVTLRRKAAKINRLVLLLGGDMVEGQDIFPHQAWETDVDAVRQIIKDGPELMASAILRLGQVFPEVDIHAVPGNHGRLSKTGSPSFNGDSIFYEITRLLVSQAKSKSQLTWNLPLDRDPNNQWWARADVYGHGIVVIHGDLKGPGNQLGYPWYSLGRRVPQWGAVFPQEFEYLYVGHNHTWASFEAAGKMVLATGSIESDNAHAAKNFAALGQPHQRLGFYNKKYGLLPDHKIYLT